MKPYTMQFDPEQIARVDAVRAVARQRFVAEAVQEKLDRESGEASARVEKATPGTDPRPVLKTPASPSARVQDPVMVARQKRLNERKKAA